jgi:hypothetical protein
VLDDETNAVAPTFNIYPAGPDGGISAITVSASDVVVNPAYIANPSVQNDFAIIEVSGVNLYTSYGEFQLDTPDYAGGTVNITGYPGYPPGFGFPGGSVQAYNQFNDIGTVAVATSGILQEVTAVSYQGESGGPLWFFSGSAAQGGGRYGTRE